MSDTKPHVTPHLELGQAAPLDFYGGTYTVLGYKATVSYYGKHGSVEIGSGDCKPIVAAIAFFKEIYPSNRVSTLRVYKNVKVSGSEYTTPRTYEFYFPLEGQFVSTWATGRTSRYYRADGSSISWEEFRQVADAYDADMKRKQKELEAQRQESVNEARVSRRDYILSMNPNDARHLLGRLAQWWDGEQEAVISQNGIIIDELLEEITGIQTKKI